LGWVLRKCRQCREYTLNPDKCPYCGSNELFNPNPGRFSLEDRYGKYRRRLKRQVESTTRI